MGSKPDDDAMPLQIYRCGVTNIVQRGTVLYAYDHIWRLPLGSTLAIHKMCTINVPHRGSD